MTCLWNCFNSILQHEPSNDSSTKWFNEQLKLDSSIDSSIKRWTNESIKRWTDDMNTKRSRNRSNRSPQIEHASNRFIDSSIISVLTLISRWFMKNVTNTLIGWPLSQLARNDTSINLPILYRSIDDYVQQPVSSNSGIFLYHIIHMIPMLEHVA